MAFNSILLIAFSNSTRCVCLCAVVVDVDVVVHPLVDKCRTSINTYRIYIDKLSVVKNGGEVMTGEPKNTEQARKM